MIDWLEFIRFNQNSTLEDFKARVRYILTDYDLKNPEIVKSIFLNLYMIYQDPVKNFILIIFSVLLEDGVNPNIPIYHTGTTLANIFSQFDDKEGVDLFVKYGAIIDHEENLANIMQRL